MEEEAWMKDGILDEGGQPVWEEACRIEEWLMENLAVAPGAASQSRVNLEAQPGWVKHR